VEGFSPYPADWPPLGVPALLHRGTLGRLAGQLEFDLDIDGFRTVAIAPAAGVPGGRRAAVGLGFMFIVHEAFHQFQRDAFLSLAGDEPEEEYPILDGENTALASLEMHLLMDAIDAAARGDTVLTREIAGEFLAVRRERWSRRPDVIPRFERPQEIMEGTAEYVQVRSAGLMGGLCARPGGSPASPPGCDAFAGVTASLCLRSDFEDRLRERAIDPADMARNRVYSTGAALGLLLDFFRIDWKARASDAATSPGLAEMLGSGLRADLTRSEGLLARAKRRHGYGDLRAESERRAEAYPVAYQAGVDSLRNAPGLHVFVELRVSNLSRSRSCEGRRLVLENPRRSFSGKCHLYTLRYLATDDLLLEVRGSAIVEESDATGTSRRVEFVAPDVQAAEIDGRPLDLGVSGSYVFDRLALAGSSFQIRYKGRGTLVVDGRRISARLISPAPPEAP
jgi:hypothetical protein